MSCAIVEDRFFSGDDGWLDLATGVRVPGPGVAATGQVPDTLAQMVERAVALASRPEGAGFRVAWVEQMAPAASRRLAELVAGRVKSQGYVTLNAALRLPHSVRRVLARRHVVLICGHDVPRAAALDWIRWLSATSSRTHLLVASRTQLAGQRCGDDPRPSPAALHARERALAWDGRQDDPSWRFGVSQLRRVESAMRRKRHAEVERWLRAAFEAGRRRRDDDVMSHVGLQLMDRLVHRGEWTTAARVGRATLFAVARHDCRVACSAAVASLAIHRLQFDEADAVLAGVMAECAVLGVRAPPVVQLRCAELRFWQGRLEQAATALTHVNGTRADFRAWKTVLAHASGVRAEPRLVVSQGTTLQSRSLAAAAAIVSGHPGQARVAGSEAVRDRARPARRSPLEALLLERSVTNRRTGRGADRSSVVPWRLGRTNMHVIHAVPGLLQILSEAEDDATALTSACAWLRRQPGVRGAALVGTDGRWVAADGIRRADLSGAQLKDALGGGGVRVVVRNDAVMAVAPVRYAGQLVGVVITRGSREVAETLQEVSAATAPLCGPALRARVDAMVAREGYGASIPEIVGVSPALDAVRQAIGRAAGTGFSVLVEGESGTGKELVARALHRLSARKDRAFCPVNCAALTDDLVEAELFGYARGAFTGAVSPRAGLFEEASGSTLFLDEIAELTPRAQAKLLRALQEGEIRRLGENTYRRIDVRVVAATNRVLAQAASAGGFREDLLFRLAVARIRVPPLRERIEDIPPLARTFWAQLGPETGTRALLTPDALAALCRHTWPGNVRELQNAIAALVLVAPRRGRLGARYVAEVLANAQTGAASVLPLGAARRLFERGRIAEALARHGGRRSAAARELGLSRQGLSKALRRVGLTPSREGDEAGVA